MEEPRDANGRPLGMYPYEWLGPEDRKRHDAYYGLPQINTTEEPRAVLISRQLFEEMAIAWCEQRAVGPFEVRWGEPDEGVYTPSVWRAE